MRWCSMYGAYCRCRCIITLLFCETTWLSVFARLCLGKSQINHIVYVLIFWEDAESIPIVHKRSLRINVRSTRPPNKFWNITIDGFAEDLEQKLVSMRLLAIMARLSEASQVFFSTGLMSMTSTWFLLTLFSFSTHRVTRRSVDTQWYP